MTKRTKLYIVMIAGVGLYIVLMSARPHIADPRVHWVAGAVAAISIGVSLMAALRVGRLRG